MPTRGRRGWEYRQHPSAPLNSRPCPECQMPQTLKRAPPTTPLPAGCAPLSLPWGLRETVDGSSLLIPCKAHTNPPGRHCHQAHGAHEELRRLGGHSHEPLAAPGEAEAGPHVGSLTPVPHSPGAQHRALSSCLSVVCLSRWAVKVGWRGVFHQTSPSPSYKNTQAQDGFPSASQRTDGDRMSSLACWTASGRGEEAPSPLTTSHLEICGVSTPGSLHPACVPVSRRPPAENSDSSSQPATRKLCDVG